tara:strand:+ start:348 stop:812 length:465 start_codon:yes stop_codon:yes gene_type:complete
MKYSKKELYIIQKKRTDLIRKPDPSTNTAIIAFLRKYNNLSQIPKDMTSKEWITLRQQTLDNRDFPKFQTDHFNEVIEHNQKIDKKFEDPQTQKELDSLLKKYAFAERIRLFINPLYIYSKYQKNKKEKKFNEINPIWLWIIFCALITLIIISL